MSIMGVPIGEGLEDTIYTVLFVNDQVLITQEQEDVDLLVRKLLDKYKNWSLKINLETIFLHGLGTETKDLKLEDQKCCIRGCEKFQFGGVKINKEDKRENDINNRVNQSRAITAMLNYVL